jgi:hypothetical protein
VAERPCQHPGCFASGDYRAPKSREPRDGHLWFCLEHVRRYNLAWNFFAGMSRADIEDYQRRDATWHRPTWPLGSGPNGGAQAAAWVIDDLGLLGELGLDFGLRNGRPASARPTVPEERRALAAMDLKPMVSLQEIKTRYKELAKRLHPDANGGDKIAEERLKLINQAYSYLLSCGYT